MRAPWRRGAPPLAPASARRRAATRTSGLVLAIAALAGCSSTPVAVVPSHVPGAWDWPTYGHDAQHTFAGRTTLTKATAPTLKVAWFFRTSDAVTATPTVVNGTVYVGSWARTIANLDRNERIEVRHVCEAINYRTMRW